MPQPLGPVAVETRDKGQGGGALHLLKELTTGVVKGQHSQIGWGIFFPAPARQIQKQLHEEPANTAGGVALIGAAGQRLLPGGAAGRLLQQVLQPFAALAALGYVLRTEQAQPIAQELP